jgi:hypothetical protein
MFKSTAPNLIGSKIKAVYKILQTTVSTIKVIMTQPPPSKNNGRKDKWQPTFWPVKKNGMCVTTD